MTTRQKKKDFLEAFELSLGNISIACRKIGISRRAYYNWIERDEGFREKVEEIEEEQLDFSESMLKKNIASGKEASIFFHLKTKGKKRGYIEQVETKDVSENPWELLAKKSLLSRSNG